MDLSHFLSSFTHWSTRLKAPWLLLPALLCLAPACPAAPIVIGIIPSSLSLPVTVALWLWLCCARGNDNPLRSIEPNLLRKAVPGAVTLVP